MHFFHTHSSEAHPRTMYYRGPIEVVYYGGNSGGYIESDDDTADDDITNEGGHSSPPGHYSQLRHTEQTTSITSRAVFTII